MSAKSRVLSSLAVLIICAQPVTVRGGQVLVSNLGNLPADTSPVSVTTSTFYAQQFQSGVAASLDRIIAQLGDLTTGSNGDFALSASLVAVSSPSLFPDAGTVVTTLDLNPATPIPPPNPDGSNAFANVEFDPSNPVSLSPSQFYWFVLTGASSDGSGQVDWQFTNDSSFTGPGSLAATHARNDLPGPWFTDTGGPLMIQVEGTPAVPEPTSWVLGTIGFSSVLLASRRFRTGRQVTRLPLA
jgi:hypothetical protein